MLVCCEYIYLFLGEIMEKSRINVTKSSMPTFEEYCDAINPLWESRWL